MRSYIKDYNIINPESLKHALNLMDENPGFWKLFAGGTDLMPQFYSGNLGHKNFINLKAIPELNFIESEKDSIKIASTTTFEVLQKNPVLKKKFPIIFNVSRQIASPSIQNLATIGGNIANASPSADSSSVLLALDAKLELISKNGSRLVHYKDFHKGYKKTALKENELIYSIIIPHPLKNLFQYFRKIGSRKAQAISKISLAGTSIFSNNKFSSVKIALGAVSPTPIRCYETEKFINYKKFSEKLVKNAQEIILDEISPITDIRSTASYRSIVAKNLLKEFLTRAMGDN